MIVLIKDIASVVFSSALDELIFSTNNASATVSITIAGTTVLNETYVADSRGMIIIRGLKEMFENYLITNLIESCSYIISDGSDTKNHTFMVHYCTAESSLPAELFTSSYFLSTLLDSKTTTIGRKEFLHLVTRQENSMSAFCTFYQDGIIVNKTYDLERITELNKIVTVEVSPKLFQLDNATLLHYTIICGDRKYTYIVEEEVDAAPVLLFTNSFGCQETMYCTGTLVLSPEYTRSASYISGMFRNYKIEENRVFEANTGILSEAMALWADDLFRSKEIYLLEGTVVGKEITITESTSKRDNAHDSLISFDFKYRYAQHNHNILHLPRAGRVFDYTFDNTFG